MDRNKTLALLVGTLAALAGITMGLRTADAATWHDYEGDLHPGHAYGLMVPTKARAYEATLSGGTNATARIAFFAPDGSKLGYHELSPSLPTASVAAPASGRHLLYVYEVSDGALALRVDAEQAPAAQLQRVALQREDVALGEQDVPGRFDRVMTATLRAAPVFVTLLYEGSAHGLDATVASTKGDVVTISRESGTAFSPGVWTSLSGTRTSEPRNLDGLAYSVTVHADRFEGTMVLTALLLDPKAPPTLAPAPPAREGVALPPADGATFTLPVGKAVAFHAAPGALLVEPGDAEARSHRGGALSLYSPDDTLLAYVTLYDRERNASIELPVEGEYVAYVHEAAGGSLSARLARATAAPALRVLALGTEEHVFDASTGVHEKGAPFTLLRAPVAMRLVLANDTLGALGMAHVENEHGMVAGTNALVAAPGMHELAWSFQDPEHFAAGEHTLTVSGVLEGRLTLTSIHYLRHGEGGAMAAELQVERLPEGPDAPREPPLPVAAAMRLLGLAR